MLTQGPITIRHPAEHEVLLRAAAGDIEAVASILQYLGADNRYLRRILLESLHDCESVELWRHIIHYLAYRRWGEDPSSGRILDQVTQQRIEDALVEAFLIDEHKQEGRFKEAILRQELEDERLVNRYTAAYLLGKRGDTSIIPLLEEMIDADEVEWQLRAVDALGEIKDKRCGYPLLRALAKSNKLVHQEARNALGKLGKFAEPALLEALDHPDSHIRWHAARALGKIGRTEGVHLLAASLRDENAAVRWAAADVLAQLDKAAVVPILEQLVKTPLTEPFRQAVFHALHAMPSRQTQARLRPLLEALQGPAARLEAPAISQRLLLKWKEPSEKR